MRVETCTVLGSECSHVYDPRLIVLPPMMRTSLDGYIRDGRELGSFLSAVISNDLLGAFARADQHSAKHLQDIVLYCSATLPAAAWGSAETVANWRRKKAAEARQWAQVNA